MANTQSHLCLIIALIGLLSVCVVADASTVPAKQKAGTSESVRTLDAITIEGEIAVPQVLFITSRDYPRYRDGMGLNFRRSALDIARSTVLPTRLRVVAKQVQDKE